MTSKGSDQTARMRRLICSFAGRTYHIVGNLMWWLICFTLTGKRLRCYKKNQTGCIACHQSNLNKPQVSTSDLKISKINPIHGILFKNLIHDTRGLVREH